MTRYCRYPRPALAVPAQAHMKLFAPRRKPLQAPTRDITNSLSTSLSQTSSNTWARQRRSRKRFSASPVILLLSSTALVAGCSANPTRTLPGPLGQPNKTSRKKTMADLTLCLPPEIMAMVMSAPQIDLLTLLRCVRVCKAWQSLVYKSNSLRSRLFLPRNSLSEFQGDIDGSCGTASLKVEIVADVGCDERLASAESMAKFNRQDVEIHPLLLRHRISRKARFPKDWSRIETGNVDNDFERGENAAEEIESNTEEIENHAEESDNDAEDDETTILTLSYRLLEHFYRLQQSRATSWHNMYATSPAISSIDLRVEVVWCKGATCNVTKKLRISGGITIKDMFDAVWDTRLLQNKGLVPEDDSCLGNAERKCVCYNIFGDLEQDWVEVRRLKGQHRFVEENEDGLLE